MSIEILRYQEKYSERWDEFCKQAINSTILHTRRFLNYHGSRFKDYSIMIIEKGDLIGLLPAAISPSDPLTIVSHPGITYGGLVHDGRLAGSRTITAFEAVTKYFANIGFHALLYKCIPYIYSKTPSQDDLFALEIIGARRIRCDLSSCIDLFAQRTLNNRRKRSLIKAKKLVTVSNDSRHFGNVWEIIAHNLAKKYSTTPTHNLTELIFLQNLFSKNIFIRTALINGTPEAGIIFFNSRNVWHTQYIGASEIGLKASALDALFDSTINEARFNGARYFDFGTSNENFGKSLNSSLYQFKSEFGGGGVAHEFYELKFQS